MTFTAGVPTVWLMLLQAHGGQQSEAAASQDGGIGGSAMPRSMIKKFQDMGVEVRHAWGMTEM